MNGIFMRCDVCEYETRELEETYDFKFCKYCEDYLCYYCRENHPCFGDDKMKKEIWIHPKLRKQWMEVIFNQNDFHCKVKRFWKWGRKRAITEKGRSSLFELIYGGWKHK